MKRIIRLTENDLTRIVKRVLNEQFGENVINLNHHLDSAELKDLKHQLNFHEINPHSFQDKVHAHWDGKNHLRLEVPHLGKSHDIELDLEGGFDHSHVSFGAGVKIPIKIGYNKPHS